MKPNNKKRKRYLKLPVYLFIALFMLVLCAGFSVNTYAAENDTQTTNNKDSYTPNDPSIYNSVKWTKGNVKYWNQHVTIWYMPGFDKTRSYIRITDAKGNPINDLTRLEASWKIGKKTYHVNKVRKDGIFTWGNVTSKEGNLSAYGAASSKFAKFLTHEKCKELWPNYEEANFVWTWNYDVEELVYLYVWYLDPTTGEEVAASFAPNGEHPQYNDDGTLKGIFDLENNLLSNYGLNEVGIPSVIEDGIFIPTISYSQQKKGETTSTSGLFYGDENNASNPFNAILNIFLKVLIIVVIVGAAYFLIKLFIQKVIVKAVKKIFF